MTDIETIIRSIDDHLAELAGEISKLQAARGALTQNGREASKPARRPRRRRADGQRATEVVPAGKLMRLLADSDGLTTAALAASANGERDQVLTLLREMEAAGQVRRTGERRATRWRVE